MGSVYLQGADLARYGVSSAKPEKIAQASQLMDAFMCRPEGLVHVADANGNPCYMAALDPNLTFTATEAFGPGVGITVAVTGPLAMLSVGDPVTLDRGTELAETVQVTSIDVAHNTITLASTAAYGGVTIQFHHEAGCLIETGLTITELRPLPKGRSQVMLHSVPVARIVGGVGRYAYGRRGDDANIDLNGFNLLASLQKFGGPPAWEVWPANASAGIDARTGQLWVPAGIMLAYYSDVRVSYVAGYTYAHLPTVIKAACAKIIQSMAMLPDMGDVRKYQAGGSSIEMFASTALSQDIQSMLLPYRINLFA